MALLPLQLLLVARWPQAAGMAPARQPRVGGGALRAAAGEHVPPSRQAQSCPEAQGAWRSWLDAGDEWLSPECHPWRSAGCEKCSPPHPHTGHTLVTLGQSRHALSFPFCLLKWGKAVLT